MKTHTKLQMPEDSAWERKTIRKHIPSWMLYVYEGILNIIRWIPVLYKDKDWDYNFIYEIIKTKLINQRAYIVHHNRHADVESTNRYITICLNLIERVQEDYYSMEYLDYCKDDFKFIDVPDNTELKELIIVPVSERFDDYFNKYPSAVKKVLKSDRNLSNSKKRLALALAQHNQKKCQDLLFKILNEHVGGWWD